MTIKTHVPAKHLQKISIGFYELFDHTERIGTIQKVRGSWVVKCENGDSGTCPSGSRIKAINTLLQMHRGWCQNGK